MTTTTTPTPRPLPTQPPRAAGESVESYGLRTLAFLLLTGCTATVDDEGLTLAGYVVPLAVSGAGLSPQAAERIAEAQRRITSALAIRAALDAAPVGAVEAPQPASQERPNLGPMAPLAPPPTMPPAPSAARPLPVAPVAARVPVTGPASVPARHTAISPALGVRTPAPVPAATQDWGF